MNQKLLDSYLKRLDKSLSGVAVSDRAEIVTEIKSHILDTVEGSPEATVESVIRDLGDPSEVAKRFLNDRGVVYQQPVKQPIMKWLVIGFLGTFLIMAVFSLVMVWKFSPLIKVDEKSGRVQLLGGAIDIQEGKFDKSLHFNSQIAGESFFKGVKDLENIEPEQLVFKFNSVNVEFQNSENRKVIYQCEMEGDVSVQMNKGVDFNFSHLDEVDCKISVPKEIKVVVTGESGRVEFKELSNSVDTRLENGLIEFKDDKEQTYDFDISVERGMKDGFQNDDNNSPFKVSLRVENGQIRQD